MSSYSGAVCSICKVLLENTDDPTELVCPSCSRAYYPSREMVEYQEGAFESSHSDEMPEIAGVGASAGIIAATDDEDSPLIDMLYKSQKHKPSMGEGANTWE